ncbi:4073_t:CDS:2 [Rhizophagus irregularis]|nr:4073_t:CDS:2 [Rhizophagus irregularis]
MLLNPLLKKSNLLMTKYYTEPLQNLPECHIKRAEKSSKKDKRDGKEKRMGKGRRSVERDGKGMEKTAKVLEE